MKRIFLVLFSSFMASAATTGPLTLQNLHSKLNSGRATWHAGETKVSVLSKEEQKQMLGANMPAHSDFFYDASKKMRKVASGPAAFDWRNVGGVNYSSPILNQGRCGSCVAFASVAQLETALNIKRKTPHSPWAFSPQFIFSCGGGKCDKGWIPTDALKFLQNTGVPDESCFPYASGAVGADIACSESCSNAKDRSVKITSYRTESFFFALFTDSIKKALRKGPLLATMTVYEDFMFYKDGIYKYTSGEQLGGHAVVIEGYDDNQGAWIVRNNWGDDWGEKGYFRVAYGDDSGVGNNVWSIEVPGSSGHVTLGGLRDHEVISGSSHPIQLESTFADTQRIRWLLLEGPDTKLDGSLTSSGSTTIDTTKVSDGTYEIVPVVEKASGVERGQPRKVYVLNGALTGTIELTNVKAGEVLSGKKILEFELTSKPVPFNRIVFRGVNVATGKVVERSTYNVADKMKLSFQTENAGNGDWDFSLEGFAGTQSIKSAVVRASIKN